MKKNKLFTFSAIIILSILIVFPLLFKSITPLMNKNLKNNKKYHAALCLQKEIQKAKLTFDLNNCISKTPILGELFMFVNFIPLSAKTIRIPLYTHFFSNNRSTFSYDTVTRHSFKNLELFSNKSNITKKYSLLFEIIKDIFNRPSYKDSNYALFPKHYWKFLTFQKHDKKIKKLVSLVKEKHPTARIIFYKQRLPNLKLFEDKYKLQLNKEFKRYTN